MESFEDLGLDPGLVDALAAEGIERPTPLQEAAVPLLRRGNNVLAAAGPGAGVLVTYGTALLDRLEPGADRPRAIVLVATADRARALAESLGRLAQATGHAVAALGSPWVLPERADVLFATPSDLLAHVAESRIALDGVEALIVDGAAAVHEREGGLASVESVMEAVSADAQRAVFSLPLTDAVREMTDRHVKRAANVPARPADGGPPGRPSRQDVPDRGTVHYRIVDEPKDDGGLALVADILGEGDARHLCVFFRNEDRAADVGDFLALHGFASGAPGDADLPVWLAVDDLSARAALDEAGADVALLSWDVPAGPDALDRRHGGGRGGHVLVLPREVGHLKDTARRTGYRTVPAPPPVEERISDDLVATVERIETALAEEDVAAYLLVLESLFEEHDPAEVAAAAVALLRKKGPPAPSARSAPAATPAAGAAASAPRTWVRLFVSLGSRDGAGPGDIVGAISGETGVDGGKVGRIDIKDTFSIVEVEQAVADRVIEGLNGVSVKGRAVRVDYDRPGRDRAGRSARRPGPGRPSGGRKDPRRGGPKGRG